MGWQIELNLMVRSLICDMTDEPNFSDERIQQVIVIAAQYVIYELDMMSKYTVNVTEITIAPDPTDPRDIVFLGLVALKAACMLDQCTYRNRANAEGVKAVLGPAALTVTNNLKGFGTILEMAPGPCAKYEQLKKEYLFGGTRAIRAVLSPFVGNEFDPSMYGAQLYYGDDHRSGGYFFN